MSLSKLLNLYEKGMEQINVLSLKKVSLTGFPSGHKSFKPHTDSFFTRSINRCCSWCSYRTSWWPEGSSTTSSWSRPPWGRPPTSGGIPGRSPSCSTGSTDREATRNSLMNLLYWTMAWKFIFFVWIFFWTSFGLHLDPHWDPKTLILQWGCIKNQHFHFFPFLT